MKAVIVASGPSARGFVPPDDVTVIAVNGAIDWLPRADYWFTLDPSPANKARMHNQKPGTKYCCALDLDKHWRTLPAGLRVLRRASHRGQEPTPKHSPEWWLWRWSSIPAMSDDKGIINTGNSAWGALQLARHLGHTDIAIIGVDGTQDARIEGGAPNNLSHLPLLFNNVADDIKVTNCGYLDCNLPRMSINEWIKSRA